MPRYANTSHHRTDTFNFTDVFDFTRFVLPLQAKNQNLALCEELVSVVGHRGGTRQRQNLRRFHQLLPQRRKFRRSLSAASVRGWSSTLQSVSAPQKLATWRIHHHPHNQFGFGVATHSGGAFAKLLDKCLGEDGVSDCSHSSDERWTSQSYYSLIWGT